MGGYPGAPERSLGGGVTLDIVYRFAGLFPSVQAGALSAPGDDGPCPGNC